jgi:predicted transcriptional regulator
MKGAAARFTKLHVWKTVYNIEENKIISRKKLSKKVGVGEGSIRTILTQLKKKGIIKITQVGVSLTEKGKKFLSKYEIKILRIDAKKICVGKYAVAAFIKNRGHKIRYGLEQRDEAIKNGATGATTIVYREEKLAAPGITTNVKRDYPDIAEQIFSKFKIENNDVVIIGSGNSLKKAEDGAIAGALSLF